MIDAWGQNGNVQAAAFRDCARHLVGVVLVGVEQRHHILGGEVGFQIGGPV